MTKDKKPTLTNPYFYGGPIKHPGDFFGRQEQLQPIFEHLNKAWSTSVVGQRRSGKTSLLYHLMTEAAQHAYSFDPENYLFVYMDPQLGIRDPQEFYGELTAALAEQVSSIVPDANGEMNQRCMESVVKKLRPRRLVLLLDEFERIASADSFPEEFFAFLRGLSHRYEVCFVTTTMESLYECSSREFKSSPLFNVFATVSLGSFTDSEFDDFLAETSRRSSAPLLNYKREIFKLAGRFPFYVQMACSFCFDAWRERREITPQDQMTIRQRFTDEATPHFDRMWKKYLSPSEKAALLAMAHGKESTDSHAVHCLTQKGYAVDGKVFSSALADFILRKEAEGEALLPVAPSTPRGYATKGIWVDRKAGDVWVDGKLIPPLTNLEYRLLLCLYDNANCICDKYDIVEAVWSGDYIEEVDDSRIAKLVSRLRESIEPDPASCRYIVTVHGRGYKLNS